MKRPRNVDQIDLTLENFARKNGSYSLRRRKSKSQSDDRLNTSHNDSFDFLSDRKIVFMESGDTQDIVAIELVEQSLYFEKLFYYDSNNAFIALPEFLNQPFSSVIEYIRTGQTIIDESNVYDIFIASDYLLISKLKTLCINYLMKLADQTHIAISIWINYRHLYWPELGEMSFTKILQHFQRLWSTTEFLELCFTDIHQILTHDALNCDDEMLVFETIMRWIYYGKGNNERNIHITDLLLCIRYDLLSDMDLMRIKYHANVVSNPDAVQLVDDWITSVKDSINDKRIKISNTPRITYNAVFVFGGWCNVTGGPRAAVQVYDPQCNQWTLWSDNHVNKINISSSNNNDTSMQDNKSNSAPSSSTYQSSSSVCPIDSHGDCIHYLGHIPRRVYAGCALVENKIFLVGGYEESQVLKSTLCYDLETDSGWIMVACMYEKRHYVCVAAAMGYIYALGGHNGDRPGRLSSAERYHIKENQWERISPMTRVRSDAAAAELDGRIFVCGGFDSKQYHDTVETYNAETDQWTVLDGRMVSLRGGLSLAKYGYSLFAIGGNDGRSRLKSIERFDLATGRWQLVGTMSRGKSNLSCAVINNDIYIIGGWSDEKDAGILDSVERFEIKTGHCMAVQNLAFAASATCTCAVFGRQLVNKYLRRKSPYYSRKRGPDNLFSSEMSTSAMHIASSPKRKTRSNSNSLTFTND